MAVALSGDVDSSFSGCRGCTGVLTGFGGRDGFRAVAQQADGKVVAVGHSDAQGADWIIARYGSAGSLDSTFNGTGRRTFGFGGSANAVAIQPDGKIIVAGASTSGGFTAVRLNANGSLDATFSPGGADGDGVFKANFGLGAAAVALENGSGKIVLGGSAVNPGDATDTVMAIMWLNPNGTPDETFGAHDGKAIRDLGGDPDDATAVAIFADGSVIAAGVGAGKMAVVRFGRPIGGGAQTMTDFGGGCGASASDIVVQPDGKILVVGGQGYNCGPGAGLPGVAPVLARFDGTVPDATFGGGGLVALGFGGIGVGSASSGVATAVAVQPDGRIVVTGQVQATNETLRTQFGLVRLTRSGTFDTTFSGDGTQQVDFGSGVAGPFAMLVQAKDARIVVAGSFTTFDANGHLLDADAALVRLHAVTCNNLNATQVGTSGNDTITGTANADVIHGADGSDVVDGAGGNDTICGGDGNDQLAGGAGNDTLFGEVGTDSMNGGDGTDTCVRGGKGSPPVCDTDTVQNCETSSTCGSGLSGDWLRLVQHCIPDEAGPTRQCTLTGLVSVFNPGREATPVPAKVSFFLSEDAVLDEGDRFLAMETVRTIEAGGSQVLPFVQRMPGETDLLGHYVIAFVDSTDVVPEPNEDNNYAAGLISGGP